MNFFLDRKTRQTPELSFDDAQSVINFAAKAIRVTDEDNYNSLYLLLDQLHRSLGDDRIKAFVEYARNVMLLRTHHLDLVASYFDPVRLKQVEAQTGGIVSAEELAYYAKEAEKRTRQSERLGSKFFPRIHGVFADIEASCDHFLMHDMATKTMVGPETAIFTMGSCFAQNISRFLGLVLKLPTQHLSVGEELDSLSFLETVGGLAEALPSTVEFIANAIDPVMIYTIGIAEILQDEKGSYSVGSLKNNPALARRKTANIQDPVQIAAQLNEAFALLRKINPGLRIVLTVSPVPLEATFRRDLSILAADCLSKSTLRNAANLVADPANDIFYYPSFEFVRWLCPLIGLQAFAEDDGHPRHVSNRVIFAICLLFTKYFAEKQVYEACVNRVGPINATRSGTFDF